MDASGYDLPIAYNKLSMVIILINDRTLLAAVRGTDSLGASQQKGQVLAGCQRAAGAPQITEASPGAVLDVPVRQPLHQVPLC